jgi:hypothetical protein
MEPVSSTRSGPTRAPAARRSSPPLFAVPAPDPPDNGELEHRPNTRPPGPGTAVSSRRPLSDGRTSPVGPMRFGRKRTTGRSLMAGSAAAWAARTAATCYRYSSVPRAGAGDARSSSSARSDSFPSTGLSAQVGGAVGDRRIPRTTRALTRDNGKLLLECLGSARGFYCGV